MNTFLNFIKESSFFSLPAVRWLIVANLLPVAGVLFLNWDIGSPVVLYCIETVMMVIFFAARIIVNRGGSLLQKCVFLPFFCSWYLLITLGETSWALVTFYTHAHDSPTFLSMYPEELWLLLIRCIESTGMVPFFLSLGLFFHAQLREFILYLKSGGADEDIEWLVFKPFGRVALVMIVIIPGSFLLYFRGTDIWFTLALTIIKLSSDLLTQGLIMRKNRSHS